MGQRLVYLTPEQKRLPVYRADRGHAARLRRLQRDYQKAILAGEDIRVARAVYDIGFKRSTETWRSERSAL